MHRLHSRIVLLLLACCLAGCSLFYSYSNIERFIRWSLDDYIAWESTQESLLRSRLASQLEWHRDTQLPRYRDWLATLDRKLDNDVDVAQLTESTDQLQLFWQDTAAHLRTDIGSQLALLSDAQVHDLLATMHEKQTDLENEYADMTFAELVKKRKHEMTKTVKYWLGPLSDQQVALINAWAQQLQDGREHWLNNRRQWAAAFAQALQHRHEPELFADQIRVLFVTPEENWPAESRELSERNRNSALQLFADLHNLRTPQQRASERKRIAQWQSSLDKLAAD